MDNLSNFLRYINLHYFTENSKMLYLNNPLFYEKFNICLLKTVANLKHSIRISFRKHIKVWKKS